MKKLYAWAVKNIKTVVGISLAFVLAGVAYSVYVYMQNKKEMKFQQMYYSAERLYLKKKETFSNYNEKEKKGEKPTGDLKKDYGDSVNILGQVIQEAPQQKASRLAALLLSELQWSHQQPDEAVSTLSSVKNENDALSALVRHQLGKYLADKGDCQKAIEVWSATSQTSSADFVKSKMKLGMGLCYEKMNNMAMAESTYQELASQADKSDETSLIAQKYLRLIRSKK